MRLRTAQLIAGATGCERLTQALTEARCYADVGADGLRDMAEDQARRLLRKLACDLGYRIEPIASDPRLSSFPGLTESDVLDVMDANRPRLMATAESIADAIRKAAG